MAWPWNNGKCWNIGIMVKNAYVLKSLKKYINLDSYAKATLFAMLKILFTAVPKT